MNFNSFQTTRGNNYKLQKFVCHYNLRKYSFCSRVVNVWNSLPNNVVETDTTNIFKNRLDKHWLNQEVLFNFNADLTGSGLDWIGALFRNKPTARAGTRAKARNRLRLVTIN